MMIEPGDLASPVGGYLLSPSSSTPNGEWVGTMAPEDVVLVVTVNHNDLYNVLVLTTRGELGWTWHGNLRCTARETNR